MRNVILYVFIIFFSSPCCFAQLQWQTSLGGSDDDGASCIKQTYDGGYIVSGSSMSSDGNVTGNHGSYDYWIVKMSSSGALQWEQSFGGTGMDFGNVILQTSDSGYIVAGSTTSNDGNVTGNHGGNDFWVVKLSVSGSIQWQRTYGGTGDDIANAICQTSDGGYIIAGNTSSSDGDVSGNHGGDDYWVVKIADSGNIQWQKTYGGSGNDAALSLCQTSDGGYIVAGSSSSDDGDVSGNHGNGDYWIIKLSAVGIIQWQKCYGGSSGEGASAIRQTLDSGYIVVGNSSSDDGDVTINHGFQDWWVIKLSISGILQWQKSLGGSGPDYAAAVEQTSDSGYIIAGTTYSSDGDITFNHGASDYWVVRLSAAGTLVWQQCYGGSSAEGATSILQTADGGYTVAGSASSTDGEVTGNHGDGDYWIIKLGATTGINNVSNYPLVEVAPNPTTGALHVSGAEHVNIEMYDIAGQMIKESKNSNDITIYEFPGGLYFMKVTNAEGQVISMNKVIKE